MEKIRTVSRIHPLVAGAAISVTVLAMVGTAAIAGWLPTSKGAIGPGGAASGTPTSEFAPVEVAGKGQVPPQGAALARQAPAEPVRTAAPAPAPHKAPRPHHSTQVAQASQASQADYERPRQQAPQPQQQQQPQQPNYVGIGAGAVIGGLLGNQVGSGRGRTLATVAGAIGGGMLGNEVQKRQQEPQQPER
ncbi:glycine zipper 2TM domain-containing protein [Rugamonas sp. DEMB1]|uniref:glycine zipper 2TM domain-containing protein n=1 Tax=Rugamonas sp. DEMB1 TaxID=3039386 RepID=UPI002447AD8A|nr:glycine zipper 2TM domain-containing protein [Rugamonas sp. DEMB1]WGG50815.1 glycine zipper 2TM domain-containing protein [Rugamonas sp. DEMB1]